jgi:hypothetical protein
MNLLYTPGIRDKISRDKIPQYEIYPDIIPLYKIPQELMPQIEKTTNSKSQLRLGKEDTVEKMIRRTRGG